MKKRVWLLSGLTFLAVICYWAWLEFGRDWTAAIAAADAYH